MRRQTRRIQPRPTGPEVISHTSSAAASDATIQLSGEYLVTLQDSLQRAQVEQELWASDTILAANAVRAARIEARRQAQEEAHLSAELQRLEQQRIRDEKLAEQRAAATQWREFQRAEMERIRREQEVVEQRRREEQAMAEEVRREERRREAAEVEARRRAATEAQEARQRAAAEAERRRRERLRPCTVCMDENDVDTMTAVPCQHLYCSTCLRGKHT
jgi:hypothetical protein